VSALDRLIRPPRGGQKAGAFYFLIASSARGLVRRGLKKFHIAFGVLTSRRQGIARLTQCPWLDHLLTGEDEYVKMVMLPHRLLRLKAREPIDEAVGELFRYRGEDDTVGAR